MNLSIEAARELPGVEEWLNRSKDGDDIGSCFGPPEIVVASNKEVARGRLGLLSLEKWRGSSASSENGVRELFIIESKSTDRRERELEPEATSPLVVLVFDTRSASPLNFCRTDATDGRGIGNRMRFVGVVDAEENDRGSGDTTLIPVLFGDNGDATMGSGIV